MLKTGMNISQKMSQKLIMLSSYGITVYKQTKSKANKLDITVKDKREETCKLIDVKISADENFSVAEFEKLSKYEDLEIEVEKLWNMKTVAIPVVIGALGMIKKGTEKHLEKISGSPNLYEMQKAALTGTAHSLTKPLSM